MLTIPKTFNPDRRKPVIIPTEKSHPKNPYPEWHQHQRLQHTHHHHYYHHKSSFQFRSLECQISTSKDFQSQLIAVRKRIMQCGVAKKLEGRRQSKPQLLTEPNPSLCLTGLLPRNLSDDDYKMPNDDDEGHETEEHTDTVLMLIPNIEFVSIFSNLGTGRCEPPKLYTSICNQKILHARQPHLITCQKNESLSEDENLTKANFEDYQQISEEIMETASESSASPTDAERANTVPIRTMTPPKGPRIHPTKKRHGVSFRRKSNVWGVETEVPLSQHYSLVRINSFPRAEERKVRQSISLQKSITMAKSLRFRVHVPKCSRKNGKSKIVEKNELEVTGNHETLFIKKTVNKEGRPKRKIAKLKKQRRHLKIEISKCIHGIVNEISSCDGTSEDSSEAGFKIEKSPSLPDLTTLHDKERKKKEKISKKKDQRKKKYKIKKNHRKKLVEAEAPITPEELQEVDEPRDFLTQYCIIHPHRLSIYERVFLKCISKRTPRFTRRRTGLPPQEGPLALREVSVDEDRSRARGAAPEDTDGSGNIKQTGTGRGGNTKGAEDKDGNDDDDDDAEEDDAVVDDNEEHDDDDDDDDDDDSYNEDDDEDDDDDELGDEDDDSYDDGNDDSDEEDDEESTEEGKEEESEANNEEEEEEAPPRDAESEEGPRIEVRTEKATKTNTEKLSKSSFLSESAKTPNNDLNSESTFVFTRELSDVGLTMTEKSLRKINATKIILMESWNNEVFRKTQLEDQKTRLLVGKGRELYPDEMNYEGNQGEVTIHTVVMEACGIKKPELTDESILRQLTGSRMEQAKAELEDELQLIDIELEVIQDRLQLISKDMQMLEDVTEQLENYYFECFVSGPPDTRNLTPNFRRQQSFIYNKLRPEKDLELNFSELERSLQQLNKQLLTKKHCQYLYYILKISESCRINFRLFCVLAALSEKVTQLEPIVQNLMEKLDFEALDIKIKRSKELFNLLKTDELLPGDITTVTNLSVELAAGGVCPEDAALVLRKLSRDSAGFINFVDFVTYLPLFVEIHQKIVCNPLQTPSSGSASMETVTTRKEKSSRIFET